MKIIPAIDIIGGKVVRLTQGRYDDVKVYAEDPVEVAAKMCEAGAEYLHVVDLDGARSGRTDNYGVIERIVKETSMFVETGGGIRDMERVERYLAAGVWRVILGTAAVKNYPFALQAGKLYGGRIAIGVDVKDGKVAVQGWEETSCADGYTFCRKLCDDGLTQVIYTDISRDGRLMGTNMEAYRKLSEIKCLKVTASGGITSESELAELAVTGVDGAILGKALYEGRIDLKKALEAGGNVG